MEQFNEKGEVICQVCGKSFNIITAPHLKTHSLTMPEYKEKYPGVIISSQVFRAKQRHRKDRADLFEPTSEIKVDNEFSLDKIPNKPENFKLEPDFFEEVKTFVKEHKISEYPNPKNLIHKNKLKILNYLINIFPDVKNSYYIEKFNVVGFLDYKLITDISILSKKIDIEFPEAFWHNLDIPKASRDMRLKSDGWKIIDIPGRSPNVEQVKNILKEKIFRS